MTVNVSFPGVYIEEIPSGVRTITGVATSIAAFIGWAPKGPTDSAQLVLSFADFVRQYGGIQQGVWLGYAVSHFFANGGQQAYIIRLVGKGAGKANTTITATGGNLVLTANNEGQWATNYGILIKNLKDKGGNNTGRFRLQIAYAPPAPPGSSVTPPPTVVESFENLSIISSDPQGRYVLD
ncbi:MAG: phage tail sheath family protein, partial [Candidatus Binataceae bacterium]